MHKTSALLQWDDGVLSGFLGDHIFQRSADNKKKQQNTLWAVKICLGKVWGGGVNQESGVQSIESVKLPSFSFPVIQEQ